ncbi:hypothetical protein [Propionispira raffinosivorans]|uniref:hypothetical protein n=1 Tax=Propionispira raffinosivorans TaxID=86959 RepID=UPI00037BBA9C|nr:hypothetical protein [Propionispira raffinosivorans]
MGEVTSEKKIQLERCLVELKDSVDVIRKVSHDSILIWHANEIEEWIKYLKSQTDIEAVQSLKSEIYKRFYEKYNVRIEPKNLDDKRLTIFNKLLEQLSDI